MASPHRSRSRSPGRTDVCARPVGYVPNLLSRGISERTVGDLCILSHLNGLCMLILTDEAKARVRTWLLEHPLDEAAISVTFPERVLEAATAGKRRKGALFCQPNTLLGTIARVVEGKEGTSEVKEGDRIDVRACVKGTLVEYNARLLEKPQLLLSEYVAIVQPPRK